MKKPPTRLWLKKNLARVQEEIESWNDDRGEHNIISNDGRWSVQKTAYVHYELHKTKKEHITENEVVNTQI